MTAGERQLRTALREQLLAHGATPPQSVDELVDLAVHAAQEAVQSVLFVCERASSPSIQLAALGPAYSLLRTMADDTLIQLQEVSSKLGIATANISIEIGK